MEFTKQKSFNKVLQIFMQDHYSLREASKIYDPNIVNNHRTVAECFKYMNENKLLTSKMVSRKTLTKKGDKFRYSTWERYKLKNNFYFLLKEVKRKNEITQLLQQFLDETIITNYCKKTKEPLLDAIDKLFYYLYAHMMGMSNLIIDKQFQVNPAFANKKLKPVDEKTTEQSIRTNIKKLPLKKQVAFIITLYSAKLTPLKFSKEFNKSFSKLSKRVEELQEMSGFFA